MTKRIDLVTILPMGQSVTVLRQFAVTLATKLAQDPELAASLEESFEDEEEDDEV